MFIITGNVFAVATVARVVFTAAVVVSCFATPHREDQKMVRSVAKSLGRTILEVEKLYATCAKNLAAKRSFPGR